MKDIVYRDSLDSCLRRNDKWLLIKLDISVLPAGRQVPLQKKFWDDRSEEVLK